MEHLALEIFDQTGTGSQFLWLPDDTTLTFTKLSNVFLSGDVLSWTFTLNVYANAHVFGTAGEIHGSRLHDKLNRRRLRVWSDGLPLLLGHLRLGDEVDVDKDGNVEVTFESGKKTFEELIEGGKANQVPLIGDVRFGVALWRKRRVNFNLALTASAVLNDGSTTYNGDVKINDSEMIPFSADGEDDNTSVQEYPRMVFPKGKFKDDLGIEVNIDDCLNTDQPYAESVDGTPTNPYCNIALCYQKYGYQRKDKNGNIEDDYSSEPEAQRGYEYMPADRVNSAPNFFVIYWIRCLMEHLGIHIDENQMMDVEDLRRLFFVNTKCAYLVPKRMRSNDYDKRFGRYKFGDAGRLVAEYFGPPKVISDGTDTIIAIRHPQINPEESSLTCTGFQSSSSSPLQIERVVVNIKHYDPWSEQELSQYVSDNSYLHDAFATPECFPDADISEVIKAIEDGFGVRFLFDDNFRRVRIVLLRNLFRSSDVQKIACEVTDNTKQENGVRGFRMTYGGDTSDTHFYYKGFADLLPHKKELWVDNSDKHDYSKWNLTAEYADLINKVSAFDTTCYVTPQTGNANIIKIDKDAKRYLELHPSLFEAAGYMDAEDGDCTGEEETIKTITLGFTPAIMNDLNMDEERRSGMRKQRFALFVDETMRPRRPDLQDGTDYNSPDAVYDADKLYADGSVAEHMKDGGIVKPGEFAINSDMYASKSGLNARLTHPLGAFNVVFDVDGYINEGYRLYLQDNFEPNDDGVCPIETHDWGVAMCIMRGSGSDAHVDYEADPDDEDGNDTWDIVPGSNVAAHPDTCDSYGNEWNYSEASVIVTAQDAVYALPELFPDSNAEFYVSGFDGGYINRASIATVPDDTGRDRRILIATQRGSYPINFGQDYIPSWIGKSAAEIMAMDAAGKRIIVEMDSCQERVTTLLDVCRKAYGNYSGSIVIDNGIGSRQGRFSLKLRAEKPNPKFDISKGEDEQDEPRYLEITDENLRGRGLIDTFYKEASFWERNARIVKLQVWMGLGQLMAIDMTKRVTVGDVTGFIRKMQFSISKEAGLGVVEMEVMYI